jgi:hypothetical protein
MRETRLRRAYKCPGTPRLVGETSVPGARGRSAKRSAEPLQQRKRQGSACVMFGPEWRRLHRPRGACVTAALIAFGSGWTAVPATATVGVASTPSAVARAVTYDGQSR